MTDGAQAADWSAVAATGTDPDMVAHVVALSSDAAGRELLHAGDDRRIASATVSPGQRRAAQAARDAWGGLGVRVVLPRDRVWPRRLDRLERPPTFLAVRGRLPDQDRAAVAIVGARRATPYGTGVAAWFAEVVGASGGLVVSGGAVGIDAAAHGAASATVTQVVLGCGHGVAYPREHARPGGLFDRVLHDGGSLVSEHLPSMRPRPGVVRSRNRIVAALADVVVVVEGADRSGSLVTAGVAADLGRDVLAVPGDVRAPGSAAPHRLLREGAGVAASPDDVVAAVAAARPLGLAEVAAAAVPAPTTLPEPMFVELARRWPRPVHVGRLVEVTGMPVGAVLAAVTRGVVAGEIAESAEGVRMRREPPTGEVAVPADGR